MSNYLRIQAGIDQSKKEAVWFSKIVLATVFFGFFVLYPIQRVYDEYLRPVPWIYANLEIMEPLTGGPDFLIRYDVVAEIPVKGSWSAWLETKNQQVCFNRGRGSYSPATKRNRIWPLSEWLNRACVYPVSPFKACLKYEVETSHGARKGFGVFCSPIFTPRKEKE